MKQRIQPRSKTVRKIGEFEKHYICIITTKNRQVQPGKVSRASLRQSEAGWLWGDVEFEPVLDPATGKPIKFQAFARSWQLFAELKFTATFAIIAPWDDLGLAQPGIINVPYIPEEIQQTILDFRKAREVES